MFANRRKRLETNKTTYIHNNLVNPLSNEHSDELLWKKPANKYEPYKTINSDVAIGKTTEPVATLDVNGAINATQYMINQVSIAPPIGSIIAYTMPKSPDGWLICDGSQVSRIKYAALFEVIGVTFGLGDGNNTFHLPNYKGAFLRGTGTNGVYSGPALNTPQPHATQSHSHTATTSIIDPGHTHTQNHSHTTNVHDPGHSHVLTTVYNDEGTTAGESQCFGKTDSTTSINTVINATNTGINVEVNANNTPVDIASTQITATTIIHNSAMNSDAYETRPYNYGIYWIIKY